MADQAEKLRRVSQVVLSRNYIKSPARVIAITSGKGGVGKTSFAVNFALSLIKCGKRTLIIDADLGMGNVDVVLGCSSPYNIMHLKDNLLSVDDIIVEGPLGLKFMSGGSGFQQLSNLTDQEMKLIVDKVICCDDVFDFIIIDTGAGLNHNMLKFLLAADDIVLITTPEPTAITDAYAVLKTFIMLKGQGITRLVVNRITDNREGLVTAEKIQKVAQRFLAVDIELLGSIKEDYHVLKAIKQQQPVLIAYPDCSYANAIQNIAHFMATGDYPKEQKGFKGFLNRLFNMH